jgi:hypothetical protein
MMREQVLAQLSESVHLLEMVENLLIPPEGGGVNETVLMGMRITLRNVREGITESFAWLAEEGLEDEMMRYETAQELSPVPPSSVINEVDEGCQFETSPLLAPNPDDRAELVSKATDDTQAPNLFEQNDGTQTSQEARAVLESILRPEENPAKVLPQRRTIMSKLSLGSAFKEISRGSAGGTFLSATSGSRAPLKPLCADSPFILDAIERIVE